MMTFKNYLVCAFAMSMSGFTLHAAEQRIAEILRHVPSFYETIVRIIVEYDGGKTMCERYQFDPSIKITLPRCVNFVQAPQKIYALSQELLVVMYRDRVCILDQAGKILQEYAMNHVAPLRDVYIMSTKAFCVVTSSERPDKQFAIVDFNDHSVQYQENFPSQVQLTDNMANDIRRACQVDSINYGRLKIQGNKPLNQKLINQLVTGLLSHHNKDIKNLVIACSNLFGLGKLFGHCSSFGFCFNHTSQWGVSNGHAKNRINLLKKINLLKILYDLHLQYIKSEDLGLQNNSISRVMRSDQDDRVRQRGIYDLFWPLWVFNPSVDPEPQMAEGSDHMVDDIRKIVDDHIDDRSFGIHTSVGSDHMLMLVLKFGLWNNIVPQVLMYPSITAHKPVNKQRCTSCSILPHVLTATSFGLGCLSAYRWYRNVSSPRELCATVGGALASGFAAFKLYRNQSLGRSW